MIFVENERTVDLFGYFLEYFVFEVKSCGYLEIMV